MTWIVTHSGLSVDLINPHPSQISLEDIAHALSHVCRFAGHTATFYSVAQHSRLVSQLVPTLGALLHDAAEAYIGDVTRPLKPFLRDYDDLERRFQFAIAARFGIPLASLYSPDVKRADLTLLWTEKRDLLSARASAIAWDTPAFDPLPDRIAPESSYDAMIGFIRRFDELKTPQAQPADACA